MTTEVGHAAVSIFPSAKGFGAKLDRDIGPQLDRTGKSAGGRVSKGILGGMGGLKAGLAGVFAGAAVGGFLKGAIAEARESQKVGALTAQVIKSTGAAAGVSAEQVGKLATAISNKTGIDDEAIQSASNLLLTFTNVRNEVGKGNDIFNQATQIATDMGAALGGDPKSSAIQLGKALNDPVKGITALSRVGVSFTEQQKKQIAAMQKAGDTAGAQKIILAELNKEFGGAAAAQATAGEKAAVAFGNLKEAIGTALLPILDKVMTFTTDHVIPGLYTLGGLLKDTLGPAFKTVGRVLKPFFAGLSGQGKLSGFVGTLNEIGLGVRALIAAFKDPDVTSDGLIGVFERVGVAARQVFDFVKKNAKPILLGLGAAFVAVTAPITGIVVGLGVLYAKSQTFRSIVGTVVGYVRTQVIPALIAFGGFLRDTVFPALVKVGSFLVSTFTPTFKALAAFFTGSVLPAFRGLQERIQANMPQIQAFAKVVAVVIGVVVVLAAKIIGFLAPILIKLAGVYLRTVFAALGKLIGIFGAVIRVIGAFVHAGEAAGKGIAKAFNAVVTFFTGMDARIRRATSGMFDGIKDAFRSAIDWVIDKWNGLEFKIGGQKVFGKSLPGVTIGTPNIPHLAEGGDIRRGGSVLVGEFAPEILTLPRGARVSPLDRAGDSAGATVDITQINHGVDHLEANRLLARELMLASAGFAA